MHESHRKCVILIVDSEYIENINTGKMQKLWRGAIAFVIIKRVASKVFLINRLCDRREKMNLKEIKNQINRKEYDFLRKNEHLGDNIMLLGLGGSYSYGTNNDHSDLDLRGIALPGKREILLGNSFEQVIDEKTDTVIYSLKKIIPLLTACNPNTIEMLGLKEEHYLYVSEIGRELLDNKEMFLSQKALWMY